jgi:hypothetical protein
VDVLPHECGAFYIQPFRHYQSCKRASLRAKKRRVKKLLSTRLFLTISGRTRSINFSESVPFLGKVMGRDFLCERRASIKIQKAKRGRGLALIKAKCSRLRPK